MVSTVLSFRDGVRALLRRPSDAIILAAVHSAEVFLMNMTSLARYSTRGKELTVSKNSRNLSKMVMPVLPVWPSGLTLAGASP